MQRTAEEQLATLGRIRDYVIPDNNSVFESIRRQIKGTFHPEIQNLRQTASTEGLLWSERYRTNFNKCKFNDEQWSDEIQNLSNDLYWNDDLHLEFMRMIVDTLHFSTQQKQLIILSSIVPPKIFGTRDACIDDSIVIVEDPVNPHRYHATKLGKNKYNVRTVKIRMVFIFSLFE